MLFASFTKRDCNQPTIGNSIKGDKMEVRFEGRRCNYSSVLKKA